MTAETLRPLAGPFTKAEAWMLANVITDLDRGGIKWKLVPVGDDCVEIHRSNIGWRETIDIEAEVQEVVEQ